MNLGERDQPDLVTAQPMDYAQQGYSFFIFLFFYSFLIFLPLLFRPWMISFRKALVGSKEARFQTSLVWFWSGDAKPNSSNLVN